MAKEFSIILQNEKIRLYNLYGMLINFINAISFIIYLFIEHTNILKSLLALIAVINFAELYYRVKIFKKNKQNNQYFFGAYFAAACGWAITFNFVFAAFNLVFVFFERIIKNKKVVVVNEEGISFPSFPKRKIKWKEVQNLLIKDGLLTIDLKNNKLIQCRILSDLDEKEFNTYCIKNLKND